MKLTVVIPTFRRPHSLRGCLEGLSKQERLADEILIATQAGDQDTHTMLAAWDHLGGLRILQLTTPGAIAQYNAGLAAAKGDVVAITDDDSVPRPDWLRRIEAHFQQGSPDLGGLGGRDFVHENGALLSGAVHHVGIVRWFGRIVGNHHLGTRFYPRVDILKGVNMAFRSEAIKDLYFDADLRGGGAQTCLDMAFSLHVGKRGWRLLYDPQVAVDHYPATRFDADQRGAPTLEAIENTSFNVYLTLLRHMRPGLKRFMALFWVRGVGLESTPGILRAVLFRLKGDRAKGEIRVAANKAWADAQKVSARSSVP